MHSLLRHINDAIAPQHCDCGAPLIVTATCRGCRLPYCGGCGLGERCDLCVCLACGAETERDEPCVCGGEGR